ncbi:MAG TPA: MFS transporter [Phycisphaerae bacterium]|nr:MFS transporter [Phycisphaerae bacterium]
MSDTPQTTPVIPATPALEYGPGKNASRKWTVAALLMVMVLASMETTVTSTAMPTIVGALQGPEHYSWVASIYLLASTATMPVYGRLADILGRKRVLLAAIAIFFLGSLLASFSTSMLQLILFRGIQGLGAGGIMPVVLTILGDIFTLQERAKIQGAFSAVWGSAALAGPALGAFLVNTVRVAPHFPVALRPYLGWPTIFWINLPLALLAVLVLLFKYEDRHHHHAAADASHPANPDEASAGARGTLAIMLRSQVILPCLIVSALMGVTVFSLDTFVPLYVQGGRGMSAAAAAATVTPVMLAWASSGVFAAPLLLRWGFRKLAVAGSVLGAVGFVGLLLAAIFNWNLWVITSSLFVTGLGFGPVSMAILLAAQDAAAYRQRGMVTAGITMTRNLGGAVGISLLGGLFNLLSAPALSAAHLEFPTSDLLDPHKRENIEKMWPQALASAHTAISAALLWVFVAMLGFAALQTFVSRKLPRHKRDHATTRAEAVEAAIG